MAALIGRVQSMARAHELLSASRWQGMSLAELVRREFAPYAAGNNAEINGPEIILSAEACLAMAMVLHELVTNAAKYGALSSQDGVCWSGGIGNRAGTREGIWWWSGKRSMGLASLTSLARGSALPMETPTTRFGRQLPKRLANAFQDHHDLSVATMRVTLDHMEVSVPRGPTAQVEGFAETVLAERGVRHGRLAIIPVEIKIGQHSHGLGQAHPHDHIRVW